MPVEESELTAEEVKADFEALIRKLHEATRAPLHLEKEASRYAGAMHMFSTYYPRLLQEFYSSIEFVESMAKNKGTALESEYTSGYIRAWRWLKEVPLIKQRWLKRRK